VLVKNNRKKSTKAFIESYLFMPTSDPPFPLPQVEESALIFQESLIKIQRDVLRLPSKPPYRYYSLRTYPYAVVILATTSDGRYVLNEEYRHPTKKVLLSCPGGYMDVAESPLEAAKRELKEETGFQAESFVLMGGAYPYAGISAQKTWYVKASGAIYETAPQLEQSEIMQTKLFSPQELNSAINQGAELDGTLCTALFFNYRSAIRHAATQASYQG
jgi:ADP-ribose pyrophosphatase